MPVDPGVADTLTRHHGNGDAPYPCHAWQQPPGSDWGLKYGYCRTSLDWHDHGNPQGQGDPRCPSHCPHKAPQKTAIHFGKLYAWHGAARAAAWARAQRGIE